ncbi:MAG TPA: HAMP domain-containing sensor histidine kinase [Gemmatimonadaceae bacterium]|nr:HAMP domain-containing sensor histidine kinase [Gemmatimonadaceae bacterium]
MARRPALRTELLLNLAFLAAVALLLAVVSVLLLNQVAPDRVRPFVLVVVGLDVGIFLVFGHYLVTRLVLRPMRRVTDAADAVVAGDLSARAADAETREFAQLGEALNRMTDYLLDARGQVVRAEKLASVGRVAAGIAHEVGNPLGAIGTYVEVLRGRGTDPEVLDGIRAEIGRIDRIVRGLLDYARPGEAAMLPVHPAEIARSAFALLESQGALKSVAARCDVSADVPVIAARAHVLQQAIVNLVLNAVDAAPGGSVIIAARRWQWRPHDPAPKRLTDPASANFRRTPTARPTRRELVPGATGALVLVADSGPGVPVEERERIFEPFVTTKAPGRGTGLGLAIVARAVEDMDGVIWVDTAREGGAAFKMFFPAAGGAA